jgi:hypothetical protein
LRFLPRLRGEIPDGQAAKPKRTKSLAALTQLDAALTLAHAMKI